MTPQGSGLHGCRYCYRNGHGRLCHYSLKNHNGTADLRWSLQDGPAWTCLPEPSAGPASGCRGGPCQLAESALSRVQACGDVVPRVLHAGLWCQGNHRQGAACASGTLMPCCLDPQACTPSCIGHDWICCNASGSWLLLGHRFCGTLQLTIRVMSLSFTAVGSRIGSIKQLSQSAHQMYITACS